MSKDKEKEKDKTTQKITDVPEYVHNELNRLIKCECTNMGTFLKLCVSTGQKHELERLMQVYRGMADAIEDTLERITEKECGAFSFEIRELTKKDVEELRKKDSAIEIGAKHKKNKED